MNEKFERTQSSGMILLFNEDWGSSLIYITCKLHPEFQSCSSSATNKSQVPFSYLLLFGVHSSISSCSFPLHNYILHLHSRLISYDSSFPAIVHSIFIISTNQPTIHVLTTDHTWCSCENIFSLSHLRMTAKRSIINKNNPNVKLQCFY